MLTYTLIWLLLGALAEISIFLVRDLNGSYSSLYSACYEFPKSIVIGFSILWSLLAVLAGPLTFGLLIYLIVVNK